MGRLRIRTQQFHDTFNSSGVAPTWRGFAGVAFAIILIKVVACVWGVYSAHNGTLSRRDYVENSHHHRLISRWQNPQDIRFFELWVASDAQWYNAIAEEGYPSREQFDTGSPVRNPKLIAEKDTQLKYAFFPLWGLTIRATQVLFSDVHAAGFITANGLSMAALLILYGFLCHHVGSQSAFWTVVLYAASPFGMFFHVPFTESLFLLLAVMTFVSCERGSWWLTGLCMGLGVVTRPNGIAMSIIPAAFVIAEVVRQPGWLRSQFPRALWILVAVVPLALFLWHNYSRTGNAFVFAEVIEWWGYDETSMWANFRHNTYETASEFAGLPWHGFHRSQLDFIVLALSSLVWLVGLRVIPLHFSMYAMAILIIPLLTKGDLMSYSRYALLAWPLFLVPVVVVREAFRAWIFAIVSVLFLFFQMLNVAEFVNWHWVG